MYTTRVLYECVLCTIMTYINIYINLFLESAVFPDNLHRILICIETENNKLLIKNTKLDIFTWNMKYVGW